MPELTNLATVVAIQALGELAKVKRPMVGALRIRALMREIAAHLDGVNAERQKLLNLYGEKDDAGVLREDGGQVVFATEAARRAFAADWNELLAASWDCAPTLRVQDFGGLDVEPAHLLALGALLEDAEEQP